MAVTPSEIIGYVRLGWSTIFSAWRFLNRHKRKLAPQEKLEFRNKWKPQFTNYLAERHRDKLRTDVIIRDMRRIDTYPEISKGKGISSWFRVGLVYTYERGIMVGLRWDSIIEDQGRVRFVDWSKGETAGQKVLVTGYIPYENIESVDWDGDHYYGFPHIYCYFTFKGEPYEKIMLCKKGDLDGWPYYTDVIEYLPVFKYSKKSGIIR